VHPRRIDEEALLEFGLISASHLALVLHSRKLGQSESRGAEAFPGVNVLFISGLRSGDEAG
jgi:hypothetical protein